MLRSMFTAISALTLHQSFLDVVSDNLANANTPGFKSSRVLFQDQFAQMMSPGAAPTATTGGINPTQIGLGLQMGYVSPIFTQGMLQATGRNLDLAIQGDGFFMYNSPNGMRYSREGSLQIDANGFLDNASTGLRIQGWTLPAGSAGPIDTNTPTGDINIPLNTTLARATTNTIFGGNLDSKTAIGGSYNVTVGVYDSLGASQTVQVQFTRTADTTWDWTVTGPANAAGNGTITFDANGQADQATSLFTGAITLTGTNGAANMTTDLDLRGVTMLSNPNSISAQNQNGLAAGKVSDVFIAPNTGEVFLMYSNGLKQLAGQVALAKFANPTGLMREGHNLYAAGLNSGDAQVGASNQGGRGALVAGYMEGSNVDMAQEFTNMILAERGFQASSRVITTSDEMIQELVNLKR
jgi:flagellar hook protein FlgE